MSLLSEHMCGGEPWGVIVNDDFLNYSEKPALLICLVKDS